MRGYRGIHRDVTERRKAEEEVQRTYSKLESTVESVIQAIALTVEMRDHYTAGHQQRVKQLACAIAREMQLPNDQIQVIGVAGLLHDLGKIFVPVEILTKPGNLTEIEFAIIKTHPQSAYDVLAGIEFPWPIAEVVFQHHERMNGSGYPVGLQGVEITSEARILAVADVVEAMTFHRAYRPALGLEAALREIVRKKESLYDSRVVEACLEVFLDRGFAWGKS
jgi:HD-GYP domain-containing protein (c-di-GMP phosphodiesterase class II)